MTWLIKNWMNRASFRVLLIDKGPRTASEMSILAFSASLAAQGRKSLWSHSRRPETPAARQQIATELRPACQSAKEAARRHDATSGPTWQRRFPRRDSRIDRATERRQFIRRSAKEPARKPGGLHVADSAGFLYHAARVSAGRLAVASEDGRIAGSGSFSTAYMLKGSYSASCGLFTCQAASYVPADHQTSD